MAVIRRRTFLESLGLGAGGFLLGPIASSLVNQARGQAPARKRAVFCLVGNGINWDFNFTPPEFRQPNMNVPVLDGPKSFTWPAMVKSLERYRSRTLLVDGLANVPRTGTHGHSAGYSALACFPAANGANNDGGGPPGNITIDQYMGNALGASQWRKTVLFGASQRPDAQFVLTFASGPLKPEAQFQSPRAMFTDLFGPLAVDPNGLARGAIRQRILLDSMRGDIRRLSGALAAPERLALDHYLAAIDDFEKRQKALTSTACKPPAPAMLDSVMGTTEDRLEAMNEMAILALICGLTSVVGISIGVGMSHNYFPYYKRIIKGTPFESKGQLGETGHEPREIQGPAMDLCHNFNCSLLARVADALSAVREGAGTMFDSTVMLYTSDNGEQHHSDKGRWPLVLLGDAGGKLRTDGRFIRFPQRGQMGNRSMADLFCSMATACGVPTDSFGKGGNEPVRGPIETLMA